MHKTVGVKMNYFQTRAIKYVLIMVLFSAFLYGGTPKGQGDAFAPRLMFENRIKNKHMKGWGYKQKKKMEILLHYKNKKVTGYSIMEKFNANGDPILERAYRQLRYNNYFVAKFRTFYLHPYYRRWLIHKQVILFRSAFFWRRDFVIAFVTNNNDFAFTNIAKWRERYGPKIQLRMPTLKKAIYPTFVIGATLLYFSGIDLPVWGGLVGLIGATRYVSYSTGDDADAGDIANPWQNYQSIKDWVQSSGDICYLDKDSTEWETAGTPNFLRVLQSGSSGVGNSIIWNGESWGTGAGTGHAVCSGSNNLANLLYVYGSYDYRDFIGIEIKDTTSTAILTYGNGSSYHDINYLRCISRDNGGTGHLIRQGYDCTVDECVCYNNGNGGFASKGDAEDTAYNLSYIDCESYSNTSNDGIALHEGAGGDGLGAGFIILRGEYYSNPEQGIDNTASAESTVSFVECYNNGEGSIVTGHKAHDMECFNCNFHDDAVTPATGYGHITNQTYRNTFYNNKVQTNDSGDRILIIDTANDALAGSHDNYYYFELYVMPAPSGGIMCRIDETGTEALGVQHFRNNKFIFRTATDEPYIYWAEAGRSPSTDDLDYNQYYNANDGYEFSYITDGDFTFAALRATYSEETNGSVSAPNFTDMATDDFHLTASDAGGVAITTGGPDADINITTDHDDETINTPPDRGSFAYISSRQQIIGYY